jgi:hypothetical protein
MKKVYKAKLFCIKIVGKQHLSSKSMVKFLSFSSRILTMEISIEEEDIIEYKVTLEDCKVASNNPWEVEQLEDFLFFCCPECDERSPTKDIFIEHAINDHPLVIKKFKL